MGRGWPQETLFSFDDLIGSVCNVTEIGPLEDSSGEGIWPEGDLAICPDGSLFTNEDGVLFSVDPATGFCTLVPGMPTSEYLGGLLCAGGGILYGIGEDFLPASNVYEFNINNNTITLLGSIPFNAHYGAFHYQGDIYICTVEGLVLLDIINPENSTLVFPFPPGFYSEGATVFSNCNSILITFDYYFYLLSMVDGSIIQICSNFFNWAALASTYEFQPGGMCDPILDLDWDDSSGADDSDFNSSSFSCLTPSGSPIGDDDIVVFGEARIDQMTVSISPDFMPDGSNEILNVIMPTPNIDIDGIGTSTLILSNPSGLATFSDFRDALHAIVYINNLSSLNPGIRTVEVYYTNVLGDDSNVASAYIPVEAIPFIEVDLGPDLLPCEGQTISLTAGNPGSSYLWSTDETTQTITVAESGTYSVYVTDDNVCPGGDTIYLEFLPVVEISLIGDPFICDNEIANLTILINSPITLDIEIESSAGGPPLSFDDLSDNHSFTDPITGYTEYLISNIEPSSPVCIQLNDSTHTIEVFPTSQTLVDTSICEGDSVWLGTYWETIPGVYNATFQSIFGCDSLVTTNISVSPEVMIFHQRDTCDANAAGVFITLLENPDGCDTIIQTTISLLPLDTTYQFATTCQSSQAGVSQNAPTGTDGCDSLVITTTTYIPPADTTYMYAETCDSSQIDVINHVSTGIDGCDSITITTITLMEPDTTYIFGTSCIPAQIGVFETEYTDAQGCDSLVISTITQGMSDTTRLFTTSCDPASLGVFEDLLLTPQGCDSLIITTVTFSAQDSIFLTTATCDPLAAGVFVSSYTNQFGCDSIVTETILLNISHQILITSSNCMPSDTGVFTYQLINQFGCDSIVTETISLLPSNQTQLTETTCHADEAGTFITAHFNQYDCDSTVTRVVVLVAADTTRLNYYTCDANEVEQTENIYIAADGCDSLVIETTTLFPLPIVTVEAVADYNGFDISCHGYADGSAIANINGIAPFTYVWSTTSPDQMITGLSAGAYSVAITDGNGCETSGIVTLTEPDLLMVGFEISEPGCFDHHLGSVSAIVTGGVMPYLYSLDGGPYQTDPHFNGLGEGVYMVSVLDANDCVASEIIAIDIPLTISVSLGENQLISLGDSTTLEAIFNLPFDSIASIDWTGINNIDCPNCLTQLIAPIITTAYSVAVTSADGCADQDSVTITVSNDQNIFIPNIFSPNGDGINDVVMISAGESVREITSFSIFDRWGNLVFGAEHFQLNDSSISWDGRMKGEAMNPGVFTYRVVVDFSDGESKVIYGDITLIR